LNRFFVPGDWIAPDKVLLKGEPAHQISHVLRLKPGDHISLLDNSGWEYEVELARVSGDLVEGRLVKKGLCPGEPEIKITLYQALLKADKFELVLQKGVELGISTFVPFLSERCVARKLAASKMARWQKIAQEAAEQSGRALLPFLQPVISFEEACKRAGKPAILCWEEEKSFSLSAILKSASFQDLPALSLFIGPEGGFPPAEVDYARALGIIPVSLGHRILRAETAGLATTSAILYQQGEFG